jgi:penicillin-binding protein 2
MAQATAALANGGIVYRPRLVAYVDNPRTGERRSFEPEVVHRIPARREHLEMVKRAMAGVNKEGTAARAFAGAQYTSGGKTGTAQVIAIKQNEKYDEEKVSERHRDHSWFIVFAPLESPKIAIAVLVENGGFGSRTAAPISRTMLDYYLLGKLPESMNRPTPEDESQLEGD